MSITSKHREEAREAVKKRQDQIMKGRLPVELKKMIHPEKKKYTSKSALINKTAKPINYPPLIQVDQTQTQTETQKIISNLPKLKKCPNKDLEGVFDYDHQLLNQIAENEKFIQKENEQGINHEISLLEKETAKEQIVENEDKYLDIEENVENLKKLQEDIKQDDKESQDLTAYLDKLTAKLNSVVETKEEDFEYIPLSTQTNSRRNAIQSLLKDEPMEKLFATMNESEEKQNCSNYLPQRSNTHDFGVLPSNPVTAVCALEVTQDLYMVGKNIVEPKTREVYKPGLNADYAPIENKQNDELTEKDSEISRIRNLLLETQNDLKKMECKHFNFDPINPMQVLQEQNSSYLPPNTSKALPTQPVLLPTPTETQKPKENPKLDSMATQKMGILEQNYKKQGLAGEETVRKNTFPGEVIWNKKITKNSKAENIETTIPSIPFVSNMQCIRMGENTSQYSEPTDAKSESSEFSYREDCSLMSNTHISQPQQYSYSYSKPLPQQTYHNINHNINTTNISSSANMMGKNLPTNQNQCFVNKENFNYANIGNPVSPPVLKVSAPSLPVVSKREFSNPSVKIITNLPNQLRNNANSQQFGTIIDARSHLQKQTQQIMSRDDECPQPLPYTIQKIDPVQFYKNSNAPINHQDNSLRLYDYCK